MPSRSSASSDGTSSPPENIPGDPESTIASAPVLGASVIATRRAAIRSGLNALAGGRCSRSSRTAPKSVDNSIADLLASIVPAPRERRSLRRPRLPPRQQIESAAPDGGASNYACRSPSSPFTAPARAHLDRPGHRGSRRGLRPGAVRRSVRRGLRTQGAVLPAPERSVHLRRRGARRGLRRLHRDHLLEGRRDREQLLHQAAGDGRRRGRAPGGGRGHLDPAGVERRLRDRHRRALIGMAEGSTLDPSALAATLFAPHHFGGRFFNPWGEEPRGIRDLLRWKLGGGKTPFDKRGALDVPVVANDGASLQGVADGGELTWVGHSTFAIHDKRDVVLTDPHWSARALVPRRKRPPGIPLAAVPSR